MSILIIIGLVLVILWNVFGAYWVFKYNAETPLDYTPKTIFLGGPVWWISFVCYYISNNISIPKPEKKK